MKPVVTVAEMRNIDKAALVAESVLIERAGWHVARVAKQMMGGCYGRHVVVIAGPGNNGADGRVAASVLRQRGARVVLVAPDELDAIPACDLIIDAAFGMGFHGEYKAPETYGVKTLAVDIPSGINGDTGVACAGAVKADVTVTFAAYKPGQLLNDGPEHCGHIELCDIGLSTTGNPIDLVELSDVIAALGPSQLESHKWKTALAVVAGSPGMLGAAMLSSAAAARSGAGMVRLLLPGVVATDLPIGDAVAAALPAHSWDKDVLDIAPRLHALVIGPGLGRDDETIACVRRVIEQVNVPVVIDADGLFALGRGEQLDILKKRSAPTVLTPHDGEFKGLTGEMPGDDRVAAVRNLARETNSVILSKGSTTTVADADGNVLLSNTGSSRLATAGTGDVLSGVIGGFLARGMRAADAAAFGAHIHGLAGQRGYVQGLVASDLPELVAQELSAING